MPKKKKKVYQLYCSMYVDKQRVSMLRYQDDEILNKKWQKLFLTFYFKISSKKHNQVW